MKFLMIVLMVMVLTGCISATYRHEGPVERFTVTSFMKSVDGLYAERGDFRLKADKTHSQDPADTLKEVNKMLMLVNPAAPVK